MTQKDFELIAKVLRKSLAAAIEPDHKDIVRGVTLIFAKELGEANPRFDMMRFITAANAGDRSI